MRITLILLWIVSLWGLLIIFSSSDFYASEPLVIKLTGLEEEWIRLLSSARLHNHSIRLNISNSVPTHYLLKSCHTIIWKSYEPTKTVIIEYTQPWIPALLKLASRYSRFMPLTTPPPPTASYQFTYMKYELLYLIFILLLITMLLQFQKRYEVTPEVAYHQYHVFKKSQDFS
ncbi:hypothetical protein GCK72_010836 [Caenorhabditis remanei]|uniref:Uncharacterized protein n=1 Tax=Caenorhabditis remanei TaxID=31234 RepID=A0A6A5H719_CAERE|nr:hypothetical protein GCK72_010836 [Caenorhabditis remanei]KAF1762574.1 hypothetical protein GCK72_010836 [Caenorhabditis remanei]